MALWYLVDERLGGSVQELDGEEVVAVLSAHWATTCGLRPRPDRPRTRGSRRLQLDIAGALHAEDLEWLR